MLSFSSSRGNPAILRLEHYDDWLSSKNPEFARFLIELSSEAELRASAAPKQGVEVDDLPEAECPSPPNQMTPQASLF